MQRCLLKLKEHLADQSTGHRVSRHVRHGVLVEFKAKSNLEELEISARISMLEVGLVRTTSLLS
jgi:hypothetical protein